MGVETQDAATELRIAIAVKGVRVTQVAREAGMARDYVSRLIHGHSRLRPATVARLHEAIARTERMPRARS
jgi:plasmid maintenance system antidote protein VapI